MTHVKDELKDYLTSDPLLKELGSYIDSKRDSVFSNTLPLSSKLDVVSNRNRETEVRLIGLCRSLTHRKVHLPVTPTETSKLDTIFSEESESDENNDENIRDVRHKDQVLNQIKVVHLFWNFCLKELYKIVDTFVDRVATGALQYVATKTTTTNQKTRYRELWYENYRRFETVIDWLEPIFDYVPTNYRRWLRHMVPPEDITILEYADNLLVSRLMTKLGENFVTVIDEFLNEVRALDVEVLLNANVASHYNYPFHILYKYDSLFSHEAKHQFSFKNFYLDNLRKYTATKVLDTLVQHADIYPVLNIFLRKTTYISLLISPELVIEANEIVLEETLMNETALRKYFQLRMLESQSDIAIIKGKGPNSSDPLRSMFKFARDAFKERGKLEQYDTITAKIISEQILSKQSSMLTRHGYRDIFFLILSMHNVIIFDTANRTAARNALSQVMGGDLKLLEYFVRFCEDLIQHTDPKDSIKYHQKEDGFSKLRCHFAFHLHRFLELGPEFLPLLGKVIFRRFIMRGALAMDGLVKEDSYEFRLYDEFVRYYAHSSECQEFSALISELRESMIVCELFSKKCAADAGAAIPSSQVFEPVCLARGKVPTMFQNEPHGNTNTLESKLKLPAELQAQWNQFEKLYKAGTRNGKMKTLTPAYHLQHCEVSTPFKLPNGDTLLFDLTLYQTLVLSVFNDNNEVSFDQISARTGINEPMLLRSVLKSFTNVKLLLKRDGSHYSLNPNYHPDLRKLVGNKIRIALPKLTANSRPSSSSNDTTMTATAAAPSEHIHTEGLRSNWRRQLLCACIVRSLKARRSGTSQSELVRVVQTQIRGFSVGEFREALDVCLKDGYVAVGDGGLYSYV